MRCIHFYFSSSLSLSVELRFIVAESRERFCLFVWARERENAGIPRAFFFSIMSAEWAVSAPRAAIVMQAIKNFKFSFEYNLGWCVYIEYKLLINNGMNNARVHLLFACILQSFNNSFRIRSSRTDKYLQMRRMVCVCVCAFVNIFKQTTKAR